MRGFMAVVVAGLGLVAFAAEASAQNHVNGYVRRDGTYVAPHMRSAPDSSYNNNWSTSPNVNPYTGQTGTHAPTYNDRAPSHNGFGANPYGSSNHVQTPCYGLYCR